MLCRQRLTDIMVLGFIPIATGWARPSHRRAFFRAYISERMTKAARQAAKAQEKRYRMDFQVDVARGASIIASTMSDESRKKAITENRSSESSRALCSRIVLPIRWATLLRSSRVSRTDSSPQSAREVTTKSAASNATAPPSSFPFSYRR